MSRGADQRVALAEIADGYQELVAPLVWSIVPAVRHGGDLQFQLWVDALETIGREGYRHHVGGVEALLNLRQVPALLLLVAGVMACRRHGRWDRVKALAVTLTTNTSQGPTRW